MGWYLLIIGIIAELAGSICMKLSEGFSRLYPSLLVFVFFGISFTVFIYVLKHFDLSFAYAIWAGMGIMLISIIGMVFFKEPVSSLKIISIVINITGVVSLNVSEMKLQSKSAIEVVEKQ